MSESNVARFFKKYLDTSFTTYLNEVRMRYARQFLKEGFSGFMIRQKRKGS